MIIAAVVWLEKKGRPIRFSIGDKIALASKKQMEKKVGKKYLKIIVE